MALTIKQLSSDTSFLLSFEPIIPSSMAPDVVVYARPFTILLDPVIRNTSSSTSYHSTSTTDAKPALLSSSPNTLPVASTLAELPEPDLVIISQFGSDHCDEATLRQLPSSGTRTLILAEPAAARTIWNWRHFDRGKVRVLERWEDPRLTGNLTAVVRVPVPPVATRGQPGEVTVSFVLPDKRQKKQKMNCGMSTTVSAGAIGITYKPPSIPTLKPQHITIPAAQKERKMERQMERQKQKEKQKQEKEKQKQKQKQKQKAAFDAAPPATPETISSVNDDSNIMITSTVLSVPETASMHYPYYPSSPPPTSSRSLRSVQSTSTLLPSPTQPLFTNAANTTNNYNHDLLINFDSKPSSHHTRGALMQQQQQHQQEQQRPSSSSPSTATTIGSTSTSIKATAAVAAAAVSRPLSVLFAPHGTAFPHVAAWTSSHLLAEAALPLTALLHPMDGVAPLRKPLSYHQRSSWSAALFRLRMGIGHSGGSSYNNSTRSSIVCAGADITSRLGARAWVSTHDGGEGRSMPPRWTHDIPSDTEDADADADQNVSDRKDGDEEEEEETYHEPRAKSRFSSSSKKRVVELTQIVRLGTGDEVTVGADSVMPTSPVRAKAEAGMDRRDSDKTKSWAQGSSTTAATNTADAATTDQQDKDKEGMKENHDDNEPVMKASPADAETEIKTKEVPESKPAIAVHATPVNDRENPVPKKKRGLRTKASMMRLGLKFKSS